jgi:hypothetical protein
MKPGGPLGSNVVRVASPQPLDVDPDPPLKRESDRSAFEQACQFVQLIMAITVPAIVLLLILNSAVRAPAPGLQSKTVKAPSDASSSSAGCDTPFGTVIGVAHHVIAYSNSNSEYTSNGSHFVNLTSTATGQRIENVYTGMPWQCVEYGRRFWAMTEPASTFGSVDGAADIWSTLTVGFYLQHTPSSASSASSASAEGGAAFPLLKYTNGATTVAPQVGDLIIYPVQGGGFPFGHVAAIVGVTLPSASATTTNDGDAVFSIQVGEQNWDSHLWANMGQNYSRSIRAVYHQLTKYYSVMDPQGTIAGWVRRQPL